MSAISHSVTIVNPTLRRLLILLPVSIPAAAATVWDEVLLAGPIILLVETLGLALGFVVFAVVWACLGLSLLSLAELIWPRTRPTLRRTARKLATAASDYWHLAQRLPGRAVAAATGLCLAAGCGAWTVWLAGPTWTFVQAHQINVVVVILLVLLVLTLAIVADLIRQRVEAWVRRVAHIGRPVLRPLAALLAMIYLGPVLGWPLYRLLGYGRSTVYGLTVIAAPMFAGIWVPYYSLGVWRLLSGYA